jgi:hypothetical protein
MNRIEVFKERFVEQLLDAVPKRIPLYRKEQPWVLSTAPRSEAVLESNLSFRVPLNLELPEGKNLYDLENAIRLHKALPKFSRLQARDPRLWTRLAHVECWSYMVKRWAVGPDSDGAQTQANKIASRYFVRQSQSRALLRNGISRLWWIAELTHDEYRDNPYELTAVLLATLDITQTIMERNFGRSNGIATALLELIQTRNDLLIKEGNTSRLRVRKLGKFINMQGGLSVLDTLPKDEIKKLLNEELEKVLASERDVFVEEGEALSDAERD